MAFIGPVAAGIEQIEIGMIKIQLHTHQVFDFNRFVRGVEDPHGTGNYIGVGKNGEGKIKFHTGEDIFQLDFESFAFRFRSERGGQARQRLFAVIDTGTFVNGSRYGCTVCFSDAACRHAEVAAAETGKFGRKHAGRIGTATGAVFGGRGKGIISAVDKRTQIIGTVDFSAVAGMQQFSGETDFHRVGA